MEEGKTLLSRRSSSNRDHYLSFVIGEDEETGIEFELQNRSSDCSSVFYHDDIHGEANDRGRSDRRIIDGRRLQSSRPTAPATTTTTSKGGIKKSQSLGSDHVDMSIEGSKDVAQGYKRKTSENREVVYDFSWFDILIGVGSIVVYFVDVITDIKLAVDYFLDSKWFFGGVTTALIIGPSLVTCCFGLHWYIIDYKMEKEVIKRYSNKKEQTLHYTTPSHVWFLRFFFTALLFGPVVRTVEYLHYGCKSRSRKLDEKSRRRFHWWMLYEDVDNCLLRLFESFLESAPQLVWQLYITIITKPEENVIGTTTRAAALLSSWGSLAVSLVSYHRSLRNSREEKAKMKLPSIPFFFMWRACETGGRVLCIAMFASAFDLWVFGILVFHWIVISCWLMNQHTTFYAQRCLEKVFNIICGYVMIFCFLNLREGHTRFRFLIFYFIFYVENFFMLAFWFRFTPDLGAWFHIWGFIMVLICFVLHVIFQLLYYTFFHPTNSIKYCLPCDKYTFYESVCYDVRPEIDDVVGSPNKRYTSREMVNDPDEVPQLISADMAAGDARNFHEIVIHVRDSNEGNKMPDQSSAHQERLRKQHSNGRHKERLPQIRETN